MQPSYGRPQYAPEPPAVSLTRARPWLVGLAASATMLLLILAIGNPPVTRAIYRHAVSDDFGSRTLQSLGYFAWDFGRLDDDMHLGWANLVFDLAVLVLVLLLVAALSSGRGSFWRTFLAAWVSVIVAVLLSGYVRAAILEPDGDGAGRRQSRRRSSSPSTARARCCSSRRCSTACSRHWWRHSSPSSPAGTRS